MTGTAEEPGKCCITTEGLDQSIKNVVCGCYDLLSYLEGHRWLMTA